MGRRPYDIYLQQYSYDIYLQRRDHLLLLLIAIPREMQHAASRQVHEEVVLACNFRAKLEPLFCFLQGPAAIKGGVRTTRPLPSLFTALY